MEVDFDRKSADLRFVRKERDKEKVCARERALAKQIESKSVAKKMKWPLHLGEVFICGSR